MTASRASVNIGSTMSIRAAAFCLCLLLQPQGLFSANVEVLYAPDDAPLDRLVTLYQQAKRYIYVSVYGLTYPRAVQALVAAKKRGVDVRMLTDQERTQEAKQRTALETLRLAGIPIRVNQHARQMGVARQRRAHESDHPQRVGDAQWHKHVGGRQDDQPEQNRLGRRGADVSEHHLEGRDRR